MLQFSVKIFLLCAIYRLFFVFIKRYFSLGLVAVIVLLNVLIALVSEAYLVVKEYNSDEVFWSSRLDFITEVEVISDLVSGRALEEFNGWLRSLPEKTRVWACSLPSNLVDLLAKASGWVCSLPTYFISWLWSVPKGTEKEDPSSKKSVNGIKETANDLKRHMVEISLENEKILVMIEESKVKNEKKIENMIKEFKSENEKIIQMNNKKMDDLMELMKSCNQVLGNSKPENIVSVEARESVETSDSEQPGIHRGI
jgi:hypothetical protein